MNDNGFLAALFTRIEHLMNWLGIKKGGFIGLELWFLNYCSWFLIIAGMVG